VTRRRGSIEQTTQGRWRVRWWTEDGRHPSRTFDRKLQADRFLKDALAGRVDDEPTGRQRRPAGVTVSDVVEEWWAVTERSVKPRTAERYEDHRRIIEQHVGRVLVGDLDYHRVQRFVVDLQRDYAPKTVHHTYGVLSLVLKHAYRLGQISKPIPKPILPRITKPKLTIPTRGQVELLAEASQAWLHAAVILAGYCGLRQGELLALHQADVNIGEGWVFIHQARNKSSGALEATKTDSVRRVYLPRRVSGVLQEHLEEHAAARVFPMTASVFDKSWRRSRTAVDLDGVRFHDLRHSAASMMIAAGGTVLQVSKQLGHANATQTLDTYGHLWPDSFEDLMMRMNAYLDH
jgi:integrase